MHGQPEKLYYGNNGAVVEVARGDKGASIVNITDKEQKIAMSTDLPEGKYIDKVHNTEFKVKKGIIEGKLAPMTAYIIY